MANNHSPFHDGIRALAANTPLWCTDLVPLGMEVDGEPDARPALALVTAGTLLLEAELLPRPPAEPEEIAALLERLVLDTATNVGVLPGELALVHPELCSFLAPRLASRDIRVTRVQQSPALYQVVRVFQRALSGRSDWPIVTVPRSWAGWAWPAERSARFFRAAADCYRGGPWTLIPHLGLLEIYLSRDRVRVAAMLGDEDNVHGVALYWDPAGFLESLKGAEAQPDLHLEGKVFTITFGECAEPFSTIRREVDAAGWEVATHNAYPRLFAMNTPGGGISSADAEEIITILGALARFAASLEDPLPLAMPKIEWQDHVTGAIIRDFQEERHQPGDMLVDAQLAETDFDCSDFEPFVLESDALDHHTLQALGSSVSRPLEMSSDLTPEELQGVLALERARHFLSSLEESGKIKATERGNLPRHFVRKLAEHELWQDEYTRELLDTRKVLNEKDLPAIQIMRRILESAGLIHLNPSKLQLADPAHGITSDHHAGRLYTLLLRAFLDNLHLACTRQEMEPWPELQHAVPHFLCQLKEEPRAWLSPYTLFRRLLPEELMSEMRVNDPADLDEDDRLAPLCVSCMLLCPLMDFGLLERLHQPTPAEPSEADPLEADPSEADPLEADPSEAAGMVRKTALYDRVFR